MSGHARACVSRTPLFRWKGTQFESLWAMTIGLTNNRVDRNGDAQLRSLQLPSSVKDIGWEWTKRGNRNGERLCHDPFLSFYFAHELTRV